MRMDVRECMGNKFNDDVYMLTSVGLRQKVNETKGLNATLLRKRFMGGNPNAIVIHSILGLASLLKILSI